MTGSNSNPVNGFILFDASTFERFDHLLHQYVRHRISLPQDVDDLTQEVYLRLLRRNQSNPVYKPVAYLYATAFNVLADYWTKLAHGREELSIDDDALEDRLAGDRLAENGLAEADTFADELNLQQQLDGALARLPPTHAAVLLAHKHAGLSHGEVAQALGLSAHTVKKYVTQATTMVKAMPWDR